MGGAVGRMKILFRGLLSKAKRNPALSEGKIEIQNTADVVDIASIQGGSMPLKQ
jgi:hypothetical protein